MPMDETRVCVYMCTDSAPALMGYLYGNQSRGKELFSFEYDISWIESTLASFVFDPDLALYQGRQYTPLDKGLFGIFSDSCPDRWGRLLMQRREAHLARKDGRKPRTLSESDFLLGVYDETRMGALRFSLEEGGPFVSFDKTLAAPPWIALRTLEEASHAFEADDVKNEAVWLELLLAPGSSLGGARPKASVYAPDDSLWIAKFPSKHDEWDSGAWEMVIHDLAKKCRLDVPAAKLETFTNAGHTFIVKRFDRNGNHRIHFASAMTLLGQVDGEKAAGYLDMAAFIRANGASPKKDLRELWRRIVFNMAVSNIDDHLRNHGFILTNTGWSLSPLYDVNPSIHGDSLSINVSEHERLISFDLAIETAPYYDIDTSEAQIMVEEINSIIQENWRSFAANYALSKNAISRMEPAFAKDFK